MVARNAKAPPGSIPENARSDDGETNWPEVARQVGEWARDGRRFVNDLYIDDFHNVRRPIRTLLPEQRAWADALFARNEDGTPRYRRLLGLKIRQPGWSTLTNAYLFHRTYTSRQGRRVLSMVNHESTMERFRRMVLTFWRGLPPELRCALSPNNEEMTYFSHNGGGFTRLLAGGGSQGRGDTYNDLYATEMAKWKSRTSANSTAERAAARDETWASVLATMHDPTSQVIVESTGAGPFGLFHDLYQRTLDPKSEWHRVFVSWIEVERYQRALSPIQRRDLEMELTPTERHLFRTHGVSLEQLAWRRSKLDDGPMSESTFDREYPLTHDQPFRTDARNWFDLTALSTQLRYAEALEKGRLDKQAGLTEKRFHPPQKGVRYIISCDPSGGVGGDESSVKVTAENRVEVASWDTNTASPRQQAQQIGRFSMLYGQGQRPPVIVESNVKGFGDEVIEYCEEMGLNMWKNENNHDFRTSGAGNGGSKAAAYAHARDLLDNEICVVSDVPTVHQLMTIVEKPTGAIEAPSESKRDPPVGHDDRAGCYVIGLYGMHKMGWRVDAPAVDDVREARRRIEQMQREGQMILDRVQKRRIANA